MAEVSLAFSKLSMYAGPQIIYIATWPFQFKAVQAVSPESIFPGPSYRYGDGLSPAILEMFNTFVGISPENASKDGSERRRSIVSRACLECRRRKTKCIGIQPCTGCIACNVECEFPEFRRRGRKSRKSSVKPAEKEDYEAVVKALFPSTPIETLRGLSRDALLERAKHEATSNPLETSNNSSSAASPALAMTPTSLPGMEVSTQLQKYQNQASTAFEWEEMASWPTQGQVDNVDMSSYMQSAFDGMQPVQYSAAQSNLLLDSIFSNGYGDPNYTFR